VWVRAVSCVAIQKYIISRRSILPELGHCHCRFVWLFDKQWLSEGVGRVDSLQSQLYRAYGCLAGYNIDTCFRGRSTTWVVIASSRTCEVIRSSSIVSRLSSVLPRVLQWLCGHSSLLHLDVTTTTSSSSSSSPSQLRSSTKVLRNGCRTLTAPQCCVDPLDRYDISYHLFVDRGSGPSVGWVALGHRFTDYLWVALRWVVFGVIWDFRGLSGNAEMGQAGIDTRLTAVWRLMPWTVANDGYFTVVCNAVFSFHRFWLYTNGI